MTTRRNTMVAAALAALAAAPAAAQDDLGGACATYPAEQRPRCVSIAQAAEAAQPQLGILMAGGNPTLGTASTGGVRLGILPRMSLSGRVNVVLANVPEITSEASGSPGAYQTENLGLPVPALGVNASMGILPGAGIAPMLGGVGSVDLLASASWIPVDLLGGEVLKTAPVAWGAGVRVGLLRESFVTPGISVSLMHRRQGSVRIGNVCEDPEQPGTGPDDTVCLGAGGGSGTGGDQGEVGFNVKSWSARGAVSKRLLGFGLTAGLGWDRFESDVDFAFRGETGISGASRVFHVRNQVVEHTRTSAFLDFSYTLLVGSLVGEVGWMQGGERLEGYPADSDFDPEKGVFFGSIGARLSL